jgi:Kef-type K+ transport system membrane component KefB
MILPEKLLPLDPISDFVIVMFIIMLLPKLTEKLKLPGIFGLLMGGFILGPNLLGIITPGEGIMSFLADVGKLMVMFFAGLEIDFDEFLKSWRKSVLFGILTFGIPLLAGFGLSIAFGFSNISALLIGSLLASHTLISLPILIKYKIIKNEAIAVTVGATIFTDIAALLVLSLCVSLHTVGFSWKILSIRFIGLALYLPTILFSAKWLAGKYFSWIEKDEDNKTIMMLFIMTFAAATAELIHLEGIVGAFIGGLAVNEIIRNGKVKKNLEVLGNILFIPMFFLIVGALINPNSFTKINDTGYIFVISIILILITAKYLAAKTAGFLLKYSHGESNIMWSLSIPQVAATLAAALVAFQSKNSNGERLINETVFDSILILMAITTILGPLLTEFFTKKMHNK